MIGKQRFIAMWVLAAVIMLSFGMCEVVKAQKLESNIKSMCAEKWGSNYRMQKHCIDGQWKALDVYIKTYHHHLADCKNCETGTPMSEIAEETKIVLMCLNKWSDEQDRQNWRMVNHCCKGQFEAYNSIK